MSVIPTGTELVRPVNGLLCATQQRTSNAKVCMNEDERELILLFALDRISESEFLSSFGFDLRANLRQAAEFLEKARQEHS